MKKKTFFSTLVVTVLAFVMCFGVVLAADINVTEKLGGKEGDFWVFPGTGKFDSVYIGKQGVGGVTFFNGTIVNLTTNEGVDNPVTFGDNVRVDGRIWRGKVAGPYAGAEDENGDEEDNMPVVVNDDLEVMGTQKVMKEGYFMDDVKFAPESTVDFTDVNVEGLMPDIGGYYTVPGTAFYPNDATEHNQNYNNGSLNNPKDSVKYTAPINLPNGAKVTEIQLRANDQNAGTGVKATLRKIKEDYTTESVANVETTDDTSGDQTVKVDTDYTVDNKNNSYFIAVDCSAADNKVYDVRIKYTMLAE